MKSTLWALCVAAAACAPAVHAADAPRVIITSGSLPDAGAFPFSDAHWEAIGFFMGPEALYLFDVTLRLESVTPGPATLTLFSPNPDAAYNVPLASAGSFASVEVGARDSYVFAPNSAMRLEAYQLYWLVLRGAPSAGLKYLEAAGSLSGDAASPYVSDVGARGYDFAFSEDGGSSWVVHSGLNAIEVRGTVAPVPEPGTYLLMLGGLAFLTAFSRRGRESTTRPGTLPAR